MKTNKKQGWFYQTSTEVELLLGASFFPLPPRSEEFSSDRKDFSCVHHPEFHCGIWWFKKEASIPMNKSKCLKEIIHLPCHLDRGELLAHSRSVTGQTSPPQV